MGCLLALDRRIEPLWNAQGAAWSKRRDTLRFVADPILLSPSGWALTEAHTGYDRVGRCVSIRVGRVFGDGGGMSMNAMRGESFPLHVRRTRLTPRIQHDERV